MYRHEHPLRGPPPHFVPVLRHPPSIRHSGPFSVPRPGQQPQRPAGQFPPPESFYLHNRPPSDRYVSPHCSNFSIDRSTVIAVGGSQQIVPPADSPHLQVPLWNPPQMGHLVSDNSDQAGEEFLRCIAANKPLPDYLKGNMALNLADALKSAETLKVSVKSVTKSKSRSRSQSRTRGRSRAKSRARSRSRGRSKSHVRGKSRAKSQTRACSRSRSRGKQSHKRSKSRVRRSRSRSSSSEKSHGKDRKRKRSPDISSNNLTGNRLFEGLKLVMNSKDVEERLPSLKDAILGIQASCGKKTVENVSDEPKHQQYDSIDPFTTLENDSILLPHERVVGDFSWLQEKSQEEISVLKAKEFEEEESFLYGSGGYLQTEEHAKHLGAQEPLQMASSAFANASLDKLEFDKIKKILDSLGGTSDIGKMVMNTQMIKEGSEAFPAILNSDVAVETLKNPSVRKSLESLQSLIRATKDKRARSNGQSETSSEKQKAGDNEKKKKDKQTKIKELESLAQELDVLLREDGIGFMSPVIGFYCQKCEEFIGDLKSVETHAAVHIHSTSSCLKEKQDKHGKDIKGHSHHHSSHSQHPHSEKRGHRSGRDHQEKGHKSTRLGNLCLKEEMKKERMLITVNRGLTPPAQPTITKENKEMGIPGHAKVKEEKEKSLKTSRGKHSSESSEDDRSSKAKHAKKKKKEKKKKKKSDGS
uniref:C2H2-type domain-containing protein n=1 Tax=Nothobranchius kuhntae TaxID=321403 RepID=A0A1A8IZS6_NOTKU